MEFTGWIFLIVELLSCGNQTINNPINNNESDTVIKFEYNDDNLSENQESNAIINDFNGLIINSELSIKFDSIQTLYNSINQRQSIFDTLMIFQINNRDTLIPKSKVKFLESFDPNAAYYQFGSDTIIGGNGYCSSDFYLLKKGKLFKVFHFTADCVESSSSTKSEIYLDSTGIRLFYLKDIEDLWDQRKFKQGFRGIETEIFALFDSKKFQFGIQKIFTKSRSDMKLSDTLKFELVKYDDFNYLLPEIKFGFNN